MTQWKKGEFSICRLRRCCVALDTRDCRSLLYSHCGLRYILTRDGVFLFLRIWFNNFDAILNGGNSQNNFIRDRFCNFCNLFKFSMINNGIAIGQEGVLVQESWMAGRFLWAKFYVWLYQGVPIKYFNVYSGLHKFWYPSIPDTSTWSKFGAHGEHGDVFLFSNLGALWFSENLIRYSLHICLREVKNNLFSFKNSYLRHFSWRF